MCVGVLLVCVYMCVCTTYMPGAYQKRTLDSLGLALQML